MSKKVIIIILVVVVLLISGISYKYLSKTEELPYEFIEAERTTVSQKVSATGKVIPQRKVDLEFEVQGRIKDIKVEIGQEVKTGDVLLMLETTELEAQVLEKKAARDVAQAKLDKTLTGASAEEIRVYETAVDNARIALENAQIALKNAERNLTDIEADAKEDLKAAYEDALNTLDNAYIKIYNAFNAVELIQTTYFYYSDQDSFNVKASKQIIEQAMNSVKPYLDTAKATVSNQDIDKALSEMKDALEKTRDALAIVREACESALYHTVVSSTDKTTLDNHRSYITTALTDIVDDQQTISSTKITNDYNINTAKTSRDSAENSLKVAQGDLKSAQDKLAEIKAPARQEDIDLAKAQLIQAEANLTAARAQLAKAQLTALCDGTITEIQNEEGEIIKTTANSPAVSLICKGGFQIEADIPEVDIGKVNIQDKVEISLDAFPDEMFSGKVIKIDPAETVIEGVATYKTTVQFTQEDPRIKSGMTADIDILTAEKENVIAVPARAVINKNGQKIVRILVGAENTIKEVEVQTGIRGSDGNIEIIRGINQGDRVITFIEEE